MNATEHEEAQMRQRIISLISRLGISQRSFSLSIGKDPTDVHRILKGERHFPNGFCSAVLAKYPDIQRDWLFFGDGPMYMGEEDVIKLLPKDTRPRIPKSFSGGFLEDYYQGSKRELCQEKPLITQFADYDFTLILKNNRMTPKYERGDELAFKKAQIIEWGNDFMLDTVDGLKFKKIYDDGDAVRCVSYNKDEYPEFSVPKNLINGYYRLVGVLRIL